jgi:hypothetical protein
MPLFTLFKMDAFRIEGNSTMSLLSNQVGNISGFDDVHESPRSMYENSSDSPRSMYNNHYESTRQVKHKSYESPRSLYENSSESQRTVYSNNYESPRTTYSNNYESPRAMYSNNYESPRKVTGQSCESSRSADDNNVESSRLVKENSHQSISGLSFASVRTQQIDPDTLSSLRQEHDAEVEAKARLLENHHDETWLPPVSDDSKSLASAATSAVTSVCPEVVSRIRLSVIEDNLY